MAEVLGVVASGIAVGQLFGEVTSCIIKLKEYCKQIKDAPDDVRYLLLEIDAFSLILRHIRDDQALWQTTDNRAGSICVEHSLKLCREAVDELNYLVIELAEKIEGKGGWRRKAGAAKLVLKKEEIKRLKTRVDNATRLLTLAYQLHTK
jgi:hypothetical protein